MRVLKEQTGSLEGIYEKQVGCKRALSGTSIFTVTFLLTYYIIFREVVTHVFKGRPMG